MEESVYQSIHVSKVILEFVGVCSADIVKAVAKANKLYSSNYIPHFKCVKIEKGMSPANVWALAEFMSSMGLTVKIPCFTTYIIPFTTNVRAQAELNEVAIVSRRSGLGDTLFAKEGWKTKEGETFSRIARGEIEYGFFWTNRVKAAYMDHIEASLLLMLLDKVYPTGYLSHEWKSIVNRWISEGKIHYSHRRSYVTTFGQLVYDNLISKRYTELEPDPINCIN